MWEGLGVGVMRADSSATYHGRHRRFASISLSKTRRMRYLRFPRTRSTASPGDESRVGRVDFHDQTRASWHTKSGDVSGRSGLGGGTCTPSVDARQICQTAFRLGPVPRLDCELACVARRRMLLHCLERRREREETPLPTLHHHGGGLKGGGEQPPSRDVSIKSVLRFPMEGQGPARASQTGTGTFEKVIDWFARFEAMSRFCTGNLVQQNIAGCRHHLGVATDNGCFHSDKITTMPATHIPKMAAMAGYHAETGRIGDYQPQGKLRCRFAADTGMSNR